MNMFNHLLKMKAITFQSLCIYKPLPLSSFSQSSTQELNFWEPQVYTAILSFFLQCNAVSGGGA